MTATARTGLKKTVLLVEDSALTRATIGTALRELNCTVIAAEDGLEGVEKAMERAVELDLIVLDIQMPKMSGVTALRYIRQQPILERLPIVMLTAQSDADTVKQALIYKANDYIRKDAPMLEIKERLGKYLYPERA